MKEKKKKNSIQQLSKKNVKLLYPRNQKSSKNKIISNTKTNKYDLIKYKYNFTFIIHGLIVILYLITFFYKVITDNNFLIFFTNWSWTLQTFFYFFTFIFGYFKKTRQLLYFILFYFFLTVLGTIFIVFIIILVIIFMDPDVIMRHTLARGGQFTLNEVLVVNAWEHYIPVPIFMLFILLFQIDIYSAFKTLRDIKSKIFLGFYKFVYIILILFQIYSPIYILIIYRIIFNPIEIYQIEDTTSNVIFFTLLIIFIVTIINSLTLYSLLMKQKMFLIYNNKQY